MASDFVNFFETMEMPQIMLWRSFYIIIHTRVFHCLNTLILILNVIYFY